MRTQQRVIPRGIRNNNPLNIRIGNTWLGEVKDPTDPEFEQFIGMIYGVRAGFVLLRRYIRHYKRTTLTAIISSWAPSSENDTLKYIDTVAKMVGISPTQEIAYEDAPTLCAIVDAMIVVECGQHISMDIIKSAYSKA